MKKILFVTGFPLNNKSAGQNYSLHLVNDLNKDYQLDVIYWSFEQHKSLINNYLLECRPNSFFKTIVYSIIFIIFPLFVVRFDLNVLHYIKNNALKYDVLYFDFSQTFIYSLFVKHPCKIMMCHDVIAQKYSRNPFSFLYLWLVRISENKLLKTASTIFNFSNKDRFLIKSLYKIDSLVVPFYIDDKITQIDFSTLKLKPFFLFYGAWNRVENREGLHWFLEKILPNISSSIQFKIIGGGLTNKNILNIISQTKNVEYLGFVNNPYSIIAESKALIAPLFKGAGVKVKVIETIALGTPVIGTDVAFEGIDNIYVNNFPILIHATSISDFVEHINNLFLYDTNLKQKFQHAFLQSYPKNKFLNILKDLIQ